MKGLIYQIRPIEHLSIIEETLDIQLVREVFYTIAGFLNKKIEVYCQYLLGKEDEVGNLLEIITHKYNEDVTQIPTLIPKWVYLIRLYDEYFYKAERTWMHIGRMLENTPFNTNRFDRPDISDEELHQQISKYWYDEYSPMLVPIELRETTLKIDGIDEEEIANIRKFANMYHIPISYNGEDLREKTSD